MKRILFLLTSTFLTAATFAQLSTSPAQTIPSLGKSPVFFVDSVNINPDSMMNMNPGDVAQLTIFKPEEAITMLGEKGKDGAVYIITRKYAKSKYWLYFQQKSADYKKLVATPESDTAVQYILNKRVLTANFEGDLFLIDDKIFKGIRLLDQATLEKEFGVTDKKIGFQVLSVIPDNLHNGDKKF